MYASPPAGVTPPPAPSAPPPALWRRLLHLVLPACCLGCGEPVWDVAGSLGLCPPCRRRLVRWPQEACAACGRLLAGAAPPPGYVCGGCRKKPPPYGRMVCGWSYEPPLEAVVMGLKFRRLEYLGDQLGRELAALLAPELRECEVVTSVPLFWLRRLMRGYDQAAAVARPLAAALGLPYAAALRRRRSTPPQSRLDQAGRRRNLRGAFVARPTLCRGRHLLLVDDVTTTGATLHAAAASLMRAGARTVTALAAARTPSGEDEAALLRTRRGPTAPPARS